MDIPEIVEILPTNLPAVEANEMRLDNLFRLKDGTIVIVDYESTYSYADKIKYLNYVARTTKRYGLSEKQNQPVRMIVIYTGKGSPVFQASCDQQRNCRSQQLPFQRKTEDPFHFFHRIRYLL